MAFKRAEIEAAVAHLKQDRVLAPVIEAVGAFRLKLERDRFRMLVRSIISQQISVAAARSIRGRLEALVAPEPITSGSIVGLTPAELRTVGLSERKASYILDLATKVHSEEVPLHHFGRVADEEVIAELTGIRGIGRWTAQMFLIFSLGRLDVFPEDDLGVLAAIRNLHGMRKLPSKRTARRLSAPWRPYASIASWYCWRSLDLNKPAKANGAKLPI
jgi:DNA-3-methyladenine glycosylase II